MTKITIETTERTRVTEITLIQGNRQRGTSTIIEAGQTEERDLDGLVALEVVHEEEEDTGEA
ncbi:MAG: hypothetical protein ACK4FB_09090 [Brevundimonas sp.]|uniref:hypothetical protein n=1 Tax=Brevundimonas sp. TaxID=1871086 RepID=UPI00391D7E01